MKRKRSCLARIMRAFLCLFWIFPLALLAVGICLLSFIISPPFGTATHARVLLVGLDDKPREGGAQRSDTIILYSAKLNGSGALLLSVPRDSRVLIPGHRHFGKINAAYADGGVTKLKETLAQPDIIGADLPYHIVFDSTTVASAIDALGGVVVDVPRDMNYDDNWAGLSIHLKKGKQLLNGKQAVGFLRWRKNNHGRGSSDDFSRTERQRQLLIAMKDKMRSWNGLLRLPAVYKAFKAHSQSNLSPAQFLALAWASRQLQTDAVPGSTRTISRVSYVLCNWEYGRQRWQTANQ